MADVFVSYASEDRETAAALVEMLTAQGWTVWWDRDIPAGSSWDEAIQKGMTEARCMIVLWSEHSVRSRMVKDEANFAANRDTLVPALLDPVEIPYGYGMLQAANLSDWDGEADHPGLAQLLAATRHLLGRATAAIAPPTARRRLHLKPRLWAAALAAPVPIAALVGVVKVGRFAIQAQVHGTAVAFRLAAAQPLPSDPLELTELGASGLTSASLPPARNAAGSELATDRLLLRRMAAPTVAAASGSLAGAPPARMLTTHQSLLELKPSVLPNSTLVRLSVGLGTTAMLLQGPRPPVALAAVDGRASVAAPGMGRVLDFEPGNVELRGDTSGLELELSTPRRVVLASQLSIAGIDFVRVDRYREGGSADQVVSTIAHAAITIIGLRSKLPELTAGERLELDRPAGRIVDLDATDSSVGLTFDGTVHRVVTSHGAYAPTLAAMVTHEHPAALVVGVTVYLAAIFLVVLFRRRRLRR